ncbi:uncharacterized protein [Argopecten irradians]|uniref:uncharacterized protein n=1 Tax=Argopecten irradians TaxID=31199 RepID=UPI0037206D39
MKVSKRLRKEISDLREQMLQMKTDSYNLLARTKPATSEQTKGPRSGSHEFDHVTTRNKQSYRTTGHNVDESDDEHGEFSDTSRKQRKKTVNVKASTYDGTTPWVDFKSHFEACSRINRWSTGEKGLHLAVSLRGQAQGILGDLDIAEQEDYGALVRALEERFAPPNQTELYRVQLMERRQKANETLPELGQAIRRLVNLTYRTVSSDVKETLAKQQFIEALADSEMRIRIKQARPKNLTEAIQLSVELEAYNRCEKKSTEGQSYLRNTTAEPSEQSEMLKLLQDMQKKLESLEKDVGRIKTKSKPNTKTNTVKNRSCFNCGEEGHFKRNCPKPNKKKDVNKDQKQAGAQQVNTRRRQRRKKPRAGIGSSTAVQEAGMYIAAELHGTKVNLLVDTGATVTIISERVFDQVPDSAKPRLSQVRQEVLTASGEKIKVKGKGSFVMKLNSTKNICVEGIVAKINTDGILGLDAMQARNGSLDFTRGVLTLDGVEIPTTYKGSMGCYRLSLVEKVTLPANTEVVVQGKVCLPEGETVSNLLLVEKPDTFLKTEKALVARALCTV